MSHEIKIIFFSLRTKNWSQINKLDVPSFLTRRLKVSVKKSKKKQQLHREQDTKEVQRHISENKQNHTESKKTRTPIRSANLTVKPENLISQYQNSVYSGY